MSFRLRLTLFFVIIVVLPMIALAVLVSQIASDSESGKTDARLSAELHTATAGYESAQADSRRVAQPVADGHCLGLLAQPRPAPRHHRQTRTGRQSFPQFA